MFRLDSLGAGLGLPFRLRRNRPSPQQGAAHFAHIRIVERAGNLCAEVGIAVLTEGYVGDAVERPLRQIRRRGGERAPAPADKYEIAGGTTWKGDKDPISPYVQEHIDLIRIIRAGQRVNELQTVAESTLTAIMGREAAYTGRLITWDELLTAEQDLVPPSLAFGPISVSPVAVPGRTPLVRTWQES